MEKEWNSQYFTIEKEWNSQYFTMEKEWTGIKENCDVIVSFVRSLTGAASASSPDQVTDAKKVTNAKKARKRKRSLDSEDEEQNLGHVCVRSSLLRRCSKYFDTCLSKRWTGEVVGSNTPVLNLTLDIHTDVKYYRECFSRMSSGKYNPIPSVKHCLKLLQVASQISYLTLMEDCVRYLTSVPWSHEEETKIRAFADSEFYPSDCAADLSERLELPLSNKVRHGLLFGMTERALCRYFDETMSYADVILEPDDDELRYQELFASSFRIIISGPCQTLAENVLKHVTEGVKKAILKAKENGNDEDPGVRNVIWILNLLLETLSAKQLVEYIVEESPMSDMLRKSRSFWQDHWAETIHSVFKEVVEGRLLLKTSTRYMLLQKWKWILADHRVDDDVEGDIHKTLSTFVTTFPSEMQEKIFSTWMSENRCGYPLEEELLSVKIHENWIANLQEKIGLLEP